MSTLREAVQQFVADYDCGGCGHFAAYAENFRKALAQQEQEQEPVAWQWLDTGHFRKKLPVDAEPGAWNPLYTHPPRREWQGLTDTDRARVFRVLYGGGRFGLSEKEFAIAIEAALKEKNNG